MLKCPERRKSSKSLKAGENSSSHPLHYFLVSMSPLLNRGVWPLTTRTSVQALAVVCGYTSQTSHARPRLGIGASELGSWYSLHSIARIVARTEKFPPQIRLPAAWPTLFDVVFLNDLSPQSAKSPLPPHHGVGNTGTKPSRKHRRLALWTQRTVFAQVFVDALWVVNVTTRQLANNGDFVFELVQAHGASRLVISGRADVGKSGNGRFRNGAGRPLFRNGGCPFRARPGRCRALFPYVCLGRDSRRGR